MKLLINIIIVDAIVLLVYKHIHACMLLHIISMLSIVFKFNTDNVPEAVTYLIQYQVYHHLLLQHCLLLVFTCATCTDELLPTLRCDLLDDGLLLNNIYVHKDPPLSQTFSFTYVINYFAISSFSSFNLQSLYLI